MSLRKLVTRLGNVAKDSHLTNNLLRNNLVYYRRAREAIRQARAGDNPGEAAETAARLLQRSLTWAGNTRYGGRFSPHLEDWPILTKSDLAAAPEHFRQRLQLGIPAATGGSSGRPLRLWRSLECIAAEQAIIDSLLGDDCPPMLEQRVAVLRADYVKDPADLAPPFGVFRNRGRWLIFSNAHLNRTNLPWFLDALSSFRPDILWVYPTALSNFVRLAEEANARLSVPTVLSSSEMLTESLFAYTRDVLHARVIDRYGQGERVCSAHCDAVREYWFDRAYGHVELVPVASDAGTATPATARIIATGYWNSAFPLVRYETGDHAVIPEACSENSLKRIAQGLEPFLGVIGRADDYIVGRDGEQITGMNHIPRELDRVIQIQVIQETSSQVRILVLSKGDLISSDRRTLEENARELLPPYIKLHIEQTSELLSLPNGKTPFIIRRPEVDAGKLA